MAGVSFPVCADRHLAQPEVHYQKRPVAVGMRRREHGKSIFVCVCGEGGGTDTGRGRGESRPQCSIGLAARLSLFV